MKKDEAKKVLQDFTQSYPEMEEFFREILDSGGAAYRPGGPRMLIGVQAAAAVRILRVAEDPSLGSRKTTAGRKYEFTGAEMEEAARELFEN